MSSPDQPAAGGVPAGSLEADANGVADSAAIDPRNTHLARELKYDRQLMVARFDPLGSTIVSAALRNPAQRWHLATGKQTDLVGHTSWPRGIAFTPDGKTLLTAGYDGALCWWPLEDEVPTPSRRVIAHKGWIRAIAISPDGKTVATCGNDQLVKLWSVADGKLIEEFRGHKSHVFNLVFHPAGGHLITCELKGVIIDWDLETMREARRFNGSALYVFDKPFRIDAGGAWSMAISTDGKYFACGGYDEVVGVLTNCNRAFGVLFAWDQTEPVTQFRFPKKFDSIMTGLRFHPDGFLIGVTGTNGNAYMGFWKMGQEHPFHELKLASDAFDLDLHSNGTTLAVAHFDGVLRLYSMLPKPADAEPDNVEPDNVEPDNAEAEKPL